MSARRWVPAAVAIVGLVLALAPRVAAQDAPSIELSQAAVETGGVIGVTGTGWVPGMAVTVQVCGDSGRNGAADCAGDEAMAAQVGPDGAFATALVVTAPPAPCPCVVRASSTVSLDGGVTMPIEVRGTAQRSTAGPEDVRRQLTVNSTHLGTGGWRSWFGLAHTRPLEFTIENTGNVPVDDPTVALAVGVGAAAPSVVRAPDVGRLEPGARRTVRVPVAVDAAAWGDVRIEGELPGFADPTIVDARSGGRPWGGVVVLSAFAAMVVVAMVIGARRRRRLSTTRGARSAQEVVIDLRTEGGAVTIDLRELASAWGAYGPPDPSDVEAALRRTLVADLAPLYGLDPNDPADEPYLRAMVERTAARTLAYLRDPAETSAAWRSEQEAAS